MTRKQITYLVIVAVVLGGGGSVVVIYHNRGSSISAQSGSRLPDSSLSSDSTGHPVSDLAFVVGQHDDVFVGKVLGQVGNEAMPTNQMRSVQFQVHVIKNIKGNLQDSVVLAQLAPDDNRPSLEIGTSYIFAVKYNANADWYTFFSNEEYHKLGNDSNLSDSELQSFADNDARVIALAQAYPYEKLNSIFVANHEAYNTYASRHYDAQGNLIDDTVVLHEQYVAAHPSSSPANGNSPVAGAPADSVTPMVSTAASATPAPVPSDTPMVSTKASDNPSPTVVPAPSSSSAPSSAVNSGSSGGSDSTASATPVPPPPAPGSTTAPSDSSSPAATPPPPPPSI